MKDRINTYFSILIITVFGAGAALIIIHVASAADTTEFAMAHSAVQAPLEQTSLKHAQNEVTR